MDGSHPVKLFRHGEGHAVDIPAGFNLPGEDAVMRQEGKRLIIESRSKTSLADVLAELAKEGPLDEDERLPFISDPPPRPIDL